MARPPVVLLALLALATCGPRAPPTLTSAQCVAAGGTPIGDPGNGSTVKNGCPAGRTLLGYLSEPGWTEGGICCAP